MKYPLYLMSVKIELHRRIRRSVVLVRASLMYGTNYKHFNSKEREDPYCSIEFILNFL